MDSMSCAATGPRWQTGTEVKMWLTSSGFPRAAAVLLHSFFRKSSEKELDGRLLSRAMKGISAAAVWSVDSEKKEQERRGTEDHTAQWVNRQTASGLHFQSSVLRWRHQRLLSMETVHLNYRYLVIHRPRSALQITVLHYKDKIRKNG